MSSIQNSFPVSFALTVPCVSNEKNHVSGHILHIKMKLDYMNDPGNNNNMEFSILFLLLGY